MEERLNRGEHFTYKGIEWICLDYIGEDILAMTAKVWQEMPFDTDCKNDYKVSSLRRVLNTEFLEKLDKRHLVPIKLDLTADNGDKSYGECEDYVGILSCDQYRKYRDIIPLFDEWMWTCTPWYCSSPNTSYASYVRGVHPSGHLTSYGANVSSGVAPACIFSSKNLKLCRQAHLVEVDDE